MNGFSGGVRFERQEEESRAPFLERSMARTSTF
jgi:hypothetical protein